MNLQLIMKWGRVALLVAPLIFANQALAAVTKPAITSLNAKSCMKGSACSYQITATNSPTSYNATPLPAGLAVNSATGLISGTPTTVGTTTVTVSATNAGGTGSLAVTFTRTAPPAKVVVAQSGGDFTTISAALAAIYPAATPYVIEVWPGDYVEPNTVTIYGNVHIKGSGREVTTVQTALGNTVPVIEASNNGKVAISGLTISGGGAGIVISPWNGDSTSITISDNTISNNYMGIKASTAAYVSPITVSSKAVVSGNEVIGNTVYGIYLQRFSATIAGNLISGNGSAGQSDAGVYMDYYGLGSPIIPSVITGNVIRANNGSGINISHATPTISDNIIVDNVLGGVRAESTCSGGDVRNNRIVNNGDTLITDILIGDDSYGCPVAVQPNVSFNIFDDISGTRGVGAHNVKSNGDSILVP